MQFRILGPLEVDRGGTVQPISSAKQRALLAMLLLHRNEVVTSERLIDELWGQEPPETAAKSLQIYVSRLRKTLRAGDGDSGATDGHRQAEANGDVLQTRARGYMIRVLPGELDLERFEALLGAGEAALGARDATTAVARLSEGLALWRGPPLADVDLAGSGRAEIGRLDELRLRAREQRVEAELALGHHAEVIGELEALIAEHPLRDRPRGQLMLALYRCGRQTDALEVYRSTRRLLVEELGLEPGPALKDLEQAILRQDRALDAPRARVNDVPPAPEGASGPGRGRRRTPALVAVVVVGVAGAVVLATRGGGGAQAVEPNSVAVIDLQTNRLVDQVPVGTDPGDVSAAGRVLWIANTDEATVSRIDERSRRVSATIAPGTAVDGMAAGEGAVWTADSRRGLLARIDPTLRRVERSIALGSGGAYWTGAVPVASGAGSVWVATQGDVVVRIDPKRRKVQTRIPVGNGPSAIAVGEGDVWVADSFDNTVTRIDASTNSAVTTIPIGRGVGAIAVGEGGVWVAEPLDDAIARIDPRTNALTGTIPVGTAPTGITVGAGAVWVANGGSGTVSRVDPATGRVSATINVGQSPQALKVAGGALWVTVRASPPLPRDAAAHAQRGTARLLLHGAGEQPTDPAIAPPSPVGYATGALLLNYPDRPGPAGARLEPEVARAMPSVSDAGKTYTYRLRDGFGFSPPSNRPVTAAAFRRAIERALDPDTGSYARVVVDDIAGLRAYRGGRSRHIAGVRARGDTLTIRLSAPSSTLPARLAMPYFSAVPPDTPIDPRGIDGIASAGPYYLSASGSGGGLVLKRNPNYGGDRPHELEEIDINPVTTQAQAIARVEAGQADALDLIPGDGGIAARSRLQPRYGPGNEAARAGHQRYLSRPALVVDYLALNAQRKLFSTVRLRKAVNYAIDRSALAEQPPPLSFGQPTDQYIPPGMRGFRDAVIYPLGGPDVATARRLAGDRHRRAVMYTCNLPSCQRAAAIVRENLNTIGIDVDIRAFPYDVLDMRLRRAREPWDIATIGWGADYNDPEDFLTPLFAPYKSARVPEESTSINVGRFNDPRLQRRLQAASRLTDARRDRAYARLDADLTRAAAPIAAFANATNDYFFSARMGCQTIQPLYGIDLAALCARP